MGIFSSMKRGLGRGWQVKKWADYDGMKSNASYVKSLWKSLTPTKDDQSQLDDTHLSFEEMMKKHKITEDKLSKMIRRYKLYSKVYLGAALVVMAYAVYVLMQSSYFSFISCAVIALLVSSYAFRQSYFSYMLSYRRVKPTVKEWWSLTFSKKQK